MYPIKVKNKNKVFTNSNKGVIINIVQQNKTNNKNKRRCKNEPNI